MPYLCFISSSTFEFVIVFFSGNEEKLKNLPKWIFNVTIFPKLYFKFLSSCYDIEIIHMHSRKRRVINGSLISIFQQIFQIPPWHFYKLFCNEQIFFPSNGFQSIKNIDCGKLAQWKYQFWLNLFIHNANFTWKPQHNINNRKGYCTHLSTANLVHIKSRL